jgi:hypothetical protein
MHDFYVDLFKILKGDCIFRPNDTFFSNYWLSAILIDPAKTVGITREIAIETG